MGKKNHLWIGFLLILPIALAGCQGKMFSVEGAFVAEEKRIALPQEGSSSGSWQGKKDLTVNYTLARTQNELQMSGDILLRRHKKLVSFSFSTVLIGGDGKVLEVVPVTTGGGRRKIEQISFNRELSLPPDARFFSFSYSGTTGGTGDSGSPKSFWSAPW